MSEVPAPNAPKGLAGILMSVASKLDEGDTPPSFQRAQMVVLVALAVDTFWPHVHQLMG